MSGLPMRYQLSGRGWAFRQFIPGSGGWLSSRFPTGSRGNQMIPRRAGLDLLGVTDTDGGVRFSP
jgi:hypothetical protein